MPTRILSSLRATARAQPGQSHDAPLLLPLAGEIDVANASAVVEHLCRQLAGPHHRVEVDLAHVTFIDCTGIDACLEAQRRAREAGYQLTFTRPTPLVARVIEILDLDQILLQSMAS